MNADTLCCTLLSSLCRGAASLALESALPVDKNIRERKLGVPPRLW